MSPSHYLTLGLKEGNAEVLIEHVVSSPSKGKGKSNVNIRNAASITCVEITPSASSLGAPYRKSKITSSGRSRSSNWLTLLIREVLVDLRHIVDDQIVEVEFEARERRFRVLSDEKEASCYQGSDLSSLLNTMSLSQQNTAAGRASLSTPLVRKVTWSTKVDVQELSEQDVCPENENDPPSLPTSPSDPYSLVGGLTSQISEIRDLIEIPLTRPELYKAYGLKPPRGLLLHGPPGTGKTHLALTISRSLSSHSATGLKRTETFRISGPELHSPYHGETESALRALFAKAREKAPSIIILDEVDAICPRREERGGAGEGTEGRVVATLLGEMDGLGSEDNDGDKQRVVVIATTNRPNAIDPALRRPGRFDKEIEIGIPTASARTHILTVLLSKTPNTLTKAQLEDIGSKTHGYVGADLAAVVREAGTRVIKRLIHPEETSSSTPTTDPDKISHADILFVLPLVSPSALRSLTLPVQATSWSSLGGRSVQLIRQKLTEAITWPLMHPEAFERFGVQPPRGVLMYGPPGCSKTMVGRALASESCVNFLAVRGPELLNKFVGESERAVRELFAKARATKPCIIFFDEIDALATSRSAFSESSHNGILTSLLNEMDGVQDSTGVVVVGATNRPDAIDSALMRPGRLDRLIFVRPPNFEDRVAILKVKVEGMAADPNLDLEELARITEGCSGAELAALCRDAALITMGKDMNAPFVPHSHFIEAAKKVQRQITTEMLERFEDWRRKSGNMNQDT